MEIDRAIDITAEQRKTVLALLEKHLPNTAAWVYGSRAKWTSRPQSDLDLVVFATPEENGRVSDLREAFEESNLPFRVDLFIWDEVPEQFRKQIEAEHVDLVERKERVVGGGWREATLDQLGRIVTGKTPPSRIQGSFGGDIPFVTPKDLDGRRVITSTGRFLTEKGVESVYNSRIPARSVMVSCIGSDMGKAAIAARECVTNQQINSVVVDSGDEPLFVYYNLSNRKVEIRAAAGGSAQPILNKSGFGQFAILLPPLDQQRAIAHILGTLDDKIELNRRMNQTLEEMARALFKSWFVDFLPVRAKQRARTPACVRRTGRQTGDPVRAKAALITPPQGESDWSVERARAYLPAARGLAQAGLDGMDDSIADLFPDRLVDSELGPIPEGWEVKDFGDCFNLTMGQSPPGTTYNENGEGLPFFQGNADFGFRYPERRRYCTAPTRIAEPDDTLVSVRAPVGDINMAWERCCIGRGVAALRHKSASSSFTYYSAWVLQEEIQQYEHTGTVFGAINKSQFEALRVIEPPAKLVDCFETYVQSLDERIRSSVSESRILTAQRDALLPRLVSGEVRVGR